MLNPYNTTILTLLSSTFEIGAHGSEPLKKVRAVPGACRKSLWSSSQGGLGAQVAAQGCPKRPDRPVEGPSKSSSSWDS